MRSQRNLPTMGLLFLAAAAGAACGQSQAAIELASQGSDEPDAGVPQVLTVEVTQADLRFTATMPGSVQALESAELYAKVGGYLERIEVDIGDAVERGQLLAVISVPEMLPELRRHAAEIEYARSQVEQQAAAVDQARASVVAAQAGLARLQSAHREKEADLTFQQSQLARWKQLLEESPSIERRKLDEARHHVEAAAAAVSLVDADMVSAGARIEEAKASVRKAEADERVANARVPVAEANHAAMQELMQYAEIRAPFSGVITRRNVHPGAFIRPAGTNSGARPLLHIQRIDRVRVIVDLPMDCVGALNPGDPVAFENVVALPGVSFEGAVTRVSGMLGERSRMMRAEVELDNPVDARGHRKLRPGYYGDLTVFLEEYPGTPTVPASAVFTHEGEMSVFTVEDGMVRRRPIEAVFQDGTRVGVGKGLSVGQEILSTGIDEVEDGQRVRARQVSVGGL